MYRAAGVAHRRLTSSACTRDARDEPAAFAALRRLQRCGVLLFPFVPRDSLCVREPLHDTGYPQLTKGNFMQMGTDNFGDIATGNSVHCFEPHMRFCRHLRAKVVQLSAHAATGLLTRSLFLVMTCRRHCCDMGGSSPH